MRYKVWMARTQDQVMALTDKPNWEGEARAANRAAEFCVSSGTAPGAPGLNTRELWYCHCECEDGAVERVVVRIEQVVTCLAMGGW